MKTTTFHFAKMERKVFSFNIPHDSNFNKGQFCIGFFSSDGVIRKRRIRVYCVSETLTIGSVSVDQGLGYEVRENPVKMTFSGLL